MMGLVNLPIGIYGSLKVDSLRSWSGLVWSGLVLGEAGHVVRRGLPPSLPLSTWADLSAPFPPTYY